MLNKEQGTKFVQWKIKIFYSVALIPKVDDFLHMEGFTPVDERNKMFALQRSRKIRRNWWGNSKKRIIGQSVSLL